MKLLHIVASGPYFTNTFLLISNKEAVAIDPAASEKMYNDGLIKEGASLKYVLLTHGHHDHIASARALCKKHGARLIMHSEDNAQFNLNADEFYEDGKNIPLGEINITPIFSAGHTKGSVCLLCEDIMFSGDTLFQGDVGRTDLEGGNMNSLRKSLKRLAQEVPAGTQILPGHGEFTSIEQEMQHNPYLRGEV